MFSLLWRFVPGPAWLRVIVLVLAAAVIVWALIMYVYPYFAEQLMAEESTVNA